MHLSVKDKHYLKIKGWKIIFQSNGPRKQSGVAILISDKLTFNQKSSKKILKYTSYSPEEMSAKKNSQF